MSWFLILEIAVELMLDYLEVRLLTQNIARNVDVWIVTIVEYASPPVCSSKTYPSILCSHAIDALGQRDSKPRTEAPRSR